MSSAATSTGVVVLASVIAGLATTGVLTLWASVRYARRLPSFRCRLGPPGIRWRRGRARWRLRRSRATWVDGVLLVRSGALRLWLTPLPIGAAQDVTVRALGPGEVRGLGRRPMALRCTVSGEGELEIAVAAESADRLVGPFLTAALAGLPDAPRERGC